jgi:hypothetical protein
MGVFISSVAFAQSAGECSGGVCGTPQTSGGGGCGCGGGSILINNTDDGDTYQYADDYDDDGIEDDFDNCPFVANSTQVDNDGDLVGDACDICPAVSDQFQMDTDGDGMGDLCDADMDGDAVANVQDNCPQVSNIDQVNSDTDSMGDACDDDDDNDNVLDVNDNCPLVYNPGPIQETPEQLGNPKCDTDFDNDTITDALDNCRDVQNPDQADLDEDGIGDLCDNDKDGDGVMNRKDNCELTPNPTQVNADRDLKGDACDSRFCYVVNGDETNCLDPQSTFQVYSPLTRVNTGDNVRLRLFANRNNAAIEYKWLVEQRPSGSGATVEHPQGTVRVSNSYEYRYLKDKVVRFTADEPGEYHIKLIAKLVFPDTVKPDWPRETTYVMTLIAEGDSMGGCSMGGTGAGATGFVIVGLLLGLGLMVRRRK